MTRVLMILALALAASPALAAEVSFFSLENTDFVVVLAFILFVAILVYYKVPGILSGMLDKRADGIRSELDEARGLRDEAQALLASYERKQKDVQEQADRIVANARDEANRAAAQAKDDIRASVGRRLAAADDQLASAHSAAVKDVRDRAIAAAIGAARDVIAAQMSATDGNKLIDDAISTVEAKLH